MGKSLSIIHLSDLHIDPKEESESKPVFENLCKKIEQYRSNRNFSFDLLIVSGDLSHQGAKNYQSVEKRLNEILEASNLSLDRVFIVPGNHDIQREYCTDFHKAIVQLLKSDLKELNKLTDKTREALFPGFEAYLKFAENFPLTQQKKFNLPGFSQADLEISDFPIRLCGLNTALVAGPDDQGKNDEQLKDRILGCHILSKMLDSERHSEERLKIVVSHYPLSWLHKDECEEVKERLQRAGAIFFHGHIHEPEIDIKGVGSDSKLLIIGAGTLYGQKWKGRNHCQILELNSDNIRPLLYEWFWFGKHGWRGFEPLEIDWSQMTLWKEHFGPYKPEPDFAKMCKEVGLINIGKNREQIARTAYIQDVLNSVADNTELIIVGRSLIDWASFYCNNIESAIRNKKIHVKIALLDENSLPNKNNLPDEGKNISWIEKPIAEDWAMTNVLTSMKKFRRIKVAPDTGTLQIYGLPFYVSHSFVAYTKKHDNYRYCLEEVGMAIEKENRPFIELKAISPDSYTSVLEWMYKNLMTEERLLLFDNGEKRVEKDTTHRAKIISSRAEKYGLVDLAVDRTNIDWFAYVDIPKLIENTPEHGKIFILGRSLVAWTTHYMQLARAIIEKSVSCTFVIADPTKPNLKSLVKDDYAEKDLPVCWKHFQDLYRDLQKHSTEKKGCFKVYGIPAYVPTTFASYTGQDGLKFCTMEVGIGVTPNERVVLFFKKVSGNDIYSMLNKIYLGILKGRKPLLRVPEIA